ncbi:MAG TPA: uroporphyrinogen decarboxylase family protein [Anaerolineae bacterium]
MAPLTREQKFEERMAKWASPAMAFETPEAEAAYKERVQMFKDVIQVKKPVRVPIMLNIGIAVFGHAGITTEEAMYDYDKLAFAFKKYNDDFRTDTVISCGMAGSGPLFDILDYKLYQWPGRGVSPTASYQALEGEYMHADEYDLLINDPSNFFNRFYMPRVFGALAGMSSLGAITDVTELPFTGPYMIGAGLPAVQAAYEKLLEAGREAMRWAAAIGPIDGYSMAKYGVPAFIGGATKAPFDTLGDTLRGTRAIMLDKFRQPKKLLAAMERLVPLAVESGVRQASGTGVPIVFIPLHKGADGFMSDKDFKTFYWPTLKAVIVGLVNEGVVPFMFVEGGYNQRLEVIAQDPEIPAGSTIWIFDKTDMNEVKKRFGGWACFGGNVPASTLMAGTPADVEAYVRKLIDEVAGDGGYIMSTGAVVDHVKPENMHALIDTCRKYGKY